MFYPLAGMLLLSALWCGYWYIAFTGAKAFTKAKRQDLLNQGLRLDCADESWGGFPFRFEFQCKAASLQFTNANETHTIQSTKFLAVAQAYDPFHVILLIDGPSAVNGVKLTHERALVSIIAGSSGDWDISSEAAKVDAAGLLSADQVKLFARKANGKLDLAANTQQLIVPMPDSSSLSISAVELVAQTSLAVLDQPFRGPITEETLEISALKISKGPVEFAAHGKIFLDSRHRLAGKLSSQTNDIEGLMKIISPIIDMHEPDRAAIKSLLADPNAKTAKADFTASEGALYWGLFKLADLAPLY